MIDFIYSICKCSYVVLFFILILIERHFHFICVKKKLKEVQT